MLKLSQAGESIIPAMPGFYHRPHTIQELVDFMVGKIFDHIGIENNLFVYGVKVRRKTKPKN